MPTNAASLHFLMPAPPSAAQLRFPGLGLPEPMVAVRQAYARLGFVAAGELPASRSVVLTEAAPGEFASLYDSTDFGRDPAMLRQLAALISKRLATTAIVTTLRGSETFEFVLYRGGRQIDAAMSETAVSPASLATSRGRQQANLWYEALGHHRFLALTEPADTPPERIARFMTLAGTAAAAAETTADAALVAWCQLARLPPFAALRGYTSAAAPGQKLLALAESARRQASRARARSLTAYVSPEEYPYQGYFPAAWPVPARATSHFSWPVLLEFGGLASLRIAFHLDRAGEFRLEKIAVSAFSCRNGEILSATPLAQWGQTLPEEVGRIEADIAVDADPFHLRAPEAGAAYMLVVRADITAAGSGEVFMTPSLRADRVAAAPLLLPTLRLAVTRPDWIPRGAAAKDASPARQDCVLRLNAPSVHNAVAIFPDTGDDVREAARDFMARLLAPVAGTALIATVETQKHIAPGFSVTKSRQTVAMRSLLQTPLWPRLFQTDRGFQTVRIGIGLQDAATPLAGLVLQTSLRNERGEALSQSRFAGPSLAAAFWVLAEEGALALLRVDMRAAEEAFADWVRGQSPLQAWVADCAWIPEFDQYDKFALTPYEAAGPVDWFGDNLVGTLTDRIWLRRHLRFIAPRLWLGWELAELVDVRSLTAFAVVTQLEDGVEIILRDPSDLPMLEHLLAAILPAAG